MSDPPVQFTVYEDETHVVLSNGYLEVTISAVQGYVTGIKAYGIDNLLRDGDEEDRGYWDIAWNHEGTKGTEGNPVHIKGRGYIVKWNSDEQVEISFLWHTPLHIDRRFVMLRGSSGFYTYAIYSHHHSKYSPGFYLPQTRVVFRPNQQLFRFMAVADNRQREMPTEDDRSKYNSVELNPCEARLITNPESSFAGQVDDKYQYSCEDRNLQVHGWISKDPAVGFWQITPSNEFRSGGPLKQNLSSHVGPITLATFLSSHYAGEDIIVKLEDGEEWKKVLGPVFFYINSQSDATLLWDDANEKMKEEVKNWPYEFPVSRHFAKQNQRGSVSGRFLVCDSGETISANKDYVGLAAPGDAGSWQTECKGYQFWTRTDEEGYFTINNIIPGTYFVYGWISGYIGDYCNYKCVTITAGTNTDLENLIFKPPRDGPTLWEIGIADRSAYEFYIPDPNPDYINPLYVDHPDKFRQYGLWDRYTELYPDQDLVYTVGVSDYSKDWFYAQVKRYTFDEEGNKGYHLTTWQIKFKLENVDETGTYKLRMALAAANHATLEVRVNNDDLQTQALELKEIKGKVISTAPEIIGDDSAIARYGIHGICKLLSVDVAGADLVAGDDYNTIYLTQSSAADPHRGVMYDYIRLEGPPSSDSYSTT